MARYVDADKLAEMAEAKADMLISGKESFLCVAKWIKLLPSADVQEVRHERWVCEIIKKPDWKGNMQSYYQPISCSGCHIGFAVKTNYCPNCGAKMDGKDKELQGGGKSNA